MRSARFNTANVVRKLALKKGFDMFNALDLRKVTDAVQEFSHFDDDVLDSWERIKKSLEGVQTHPTNSRYVAALALYEEYLTVTSFGADTTFKLWCKERLNADKAPHCT
jgi:hypothetical protein